MIQSIHNVCIWCLLLFSATLLTAQNNQYEEYHDILPTDSVMTSFPNHNNSLAFAILPKNGTTDPSTDGTTYTITYKPNAGFFGRDTFQVIYYYPGGPNGEMSRKSKKVIVRTSPFVLNDDIFEVFTTDSSLLLDVLANDLLPSGLERIALLPVHTDAGLTISDDSLSLLFNGATKSGVEYLRYTVDNGTTRISGKITLTIKDANPDNDNQFFDKFLLKNTTLSFYHPFDITNLVIAPLHGNAQLAGAKITYEPDSSFTGRDTLVVRIGDEVLHSFNFSVLDFDRPNVLVENDYVYTIVNHAVSFDVLKNDLTNELTVDIFDPTSNGSLVKQANGKYRYTPNVNFNGADVFIYRACEPFTDVCEYGAVTITVSNYEPDQQVYLTTSKNTPLTVSYPFPATGYRLELMLSNYARNGTLINVLNNLIYTPFNNFAGADSFKVKYTLISDPGQSYVVSINVDVFDIVDACAVDCVWPGDHNSDGRVDMRDLTFMASFIGETGEGRATDLNEYWIGQSANSWDLTSSNVNLKHGDSDGNGLISAADTNMLVTNYRKLHGIHVNKGINSLFLPINLSTDLDIYYPGDEVIINVSIGNESFPVKQLAGFTASFTFSDAFVDSTISGNFNQQSWLNAGDKLLNLVKKPNASTLDFGAARISGKGVPGFGDIGQIKSIIDEVIDGFKDDDGIVYGRVVINDVFLKIDNELELRTAPQVLYIPIKLQKDETVFTNKSAVTASPNPTSDVLTIQSTDSYNMITSLHVYSITGQKIIALDKINQHKIDLNIGNYPSGMYLVHTLTNLGWEVTKISKF